LKKILHLILSFTFLFNFAFPIKYSFAADQPVIDKTAFTNTTSIIKEARARAKAGKNAEALELYIYADQVVNAEQEPILKRKISDEKMQVQKLVDDELARQKQRRIAELLAQGAKDFSLDKFDAATAAFNAVLVLDDKDRDARNHIEKLIPQRMAALKAKRQGELEQAQLKKINALYAQAKTYFKEERMDESMSIFNEILAIDLDQRDAQNYVERVIPQVLASRAKQSQEQLAALQKRIASRIAYEKKMERPWSRRADAVRKNEHADAQKLAMAAAKKRRLQSPKKGVSVAPADQPKAMVSDVEFVGNSIFDSRSLMAVVKPDLGKELSLDELRVIADRVAQYYRDGGYFLAQVIIPEQDILAQKGLVKFTVLEGRLGELAVSGTKRFSEDRVRDAFLDVRKGEPLRKQNVERSLLVLNADSGIQTSSVFRPGAETGTTNLDVAIKEKKRVEGSIEMNNLGVKSTGKNRVSPQLTFNNLTGRGDSLGVQGIKALDADKMYYAGANYATPIGAKGFQLKTYGSRGSFAVGQEFASLDIKSKTASWGLGGYYPLILNQGTTVSSELWLESKDFRQTMLSDVKTVDDRVRKVRAELFNLDHQDMSGRTILGLGVHKGLGEKLGGMKNDAPLSSRSFAKADNSFTKITPSFARAQSINDRIMLIGRLSGQYAVDPLVAGEQWSIGGMDSVHGHQSGVFLGDHGYTANLEARVTVLKTPKSTYQMLFFGDHGMIKIKKPVLGQKAKESISGTGVGLYAKIYDYNFRIDWGVPVGQKTGDSSIVSFTVKYDF
jgi:hemolysin activation/secretion protein